MTSATQTRPPMDPRLRDRRVAVIRAQGRRRLYVLLAFLALLTLAGAAVLVAFSPVLDVDRVEIRGVSGDRAAEVAETAGIDPGDPVLLVDTGAAASDLEALPWVDDARVERDLPGTIRITVTRRVLVGWVARPEGGVALVDGDGRVLADVPSAPAEVPELAGVHQVPAVGEPIRPRAAAKVLSELPADLRARTASIRMAGGVATLGLDDGPEVRLGEPTDLPTKGRVALAVLDALTGPITYLDVQVPAVPVTG